MDSNSASEQELLQFLRDHFVGVVATVKQGNLAHASTVYYYAEDDLHCYFLTKNHTLKFTNIQENHSVALVVWDAQALQTVEIEGTAREVDYGPDSPYAATVKKLSHRFAKAPEDWEKIPINHIQNSGYYVLVQITPARIRWVDYKNWEHTIRFEKTFS